MPNLIEFRLVFFSEMKHAEPERTDRQKLHIYALLVRTP